MASQRRSRTGFSIVEMLVVVSVIVALAGILFGALRGVRKTGLRTRSMNNLRQIATYMQGYSNDYRDIVLPSQFDYTDNNYKGKVRNVDGLHAGQKHVGSWADILWTVNAIGSFPTVGGVVNPLGHDYSFDSPDATLYEQLPDYEDNPLRSAAPNSCPAPGSVAGSTLPTPFGIGAWAPGDPGFFAANDFFDATPDETPGDVGTWWTRGQIKAPDRAMYLVDSLAGETIAAEPEPFDFLDDSGNPIAPCDSTTAGTGQVDFRYHGLCLMLFLDGHISGESPWLDLDDLQDNRRIKVQDLDQN